MRTVHDLTRNDLTAAVELLREHASAGPVGTDLLQSLAMLQDSPRQFYAAISGVEFTVIEPE